MEKFFLKQIKHNSSNDTWEKGVVIKDTLNEARQSFHAYLGAYGYGQSATTDYVQVSISDINGTVLDCVVDDRIPRPEPEPEPEEEIDE